MSEEYILVRDIICDHNERMLNIKKYYPYFKLTENAFTQYQGGAYADLDMGYILMAVLRFFIEENNFKENDVSYRQYASFTGELLKRDFGLNIMESEEKLLLQYIFDKIKNDGKPFLYQYFDPEDKKKKTIRMKLIESKIKDDNIYYHISSDAIEFYLDTKEIKDESSISVAQILLSKMISGRNFKGGIEVVKRINNEVGRLKQRKNEVLSLLGQDVFEGIKEYEEFIDSVMSWFEDEQKLYKKNMDMIEELLKRNNEYTEASADIYILETELKKSLGKHSELLLACTDLQKKADELIYNAKFSKLKRSFDFKHGLKVMMENDNSEALSEMMLPLTGLNIKKTFSLNSLDDMLTYKNREEEKGDIINNNANEEIYTYEDEAEDERIKDNYNIFLKILFDSLLRRNTFTLEELNEEFKKNFGGEYMKNGDYYSFIIHLCQKNQYDIQQVINKPDTFFEEHIVDFIKEQKNDRYKNLSFSLEFNPGKSIKLMDIFEITDITFTCGKKVS